MTTLKETLKKLNKGVDEADMFKIASNVDRGEFDTQFISFGSPYLDWKADGVGLGRMTEFVGWQGCLTGDTYIKYKTTSKEGKINEKGGTLISLYEKWNNLPLTNSKERRRVDWDDCVITVPCINEQEKVCHIEVDNVVYNGDKEVFLVEVEGGYHIKATLNHEFYIGGEFKPLSELSIGDEVFIHDNFQVSNIYKKKSNYYKEVYVKYHPRWKTRYIDKYLYHRATISRAAYEANMNNYSYEEYITLLNTKPKEYIDSLNLRLLEEGDQVHHKNENIRDNRPINLKLLSIKEHSQIHYSDRENNLRHDVLPHKISNIERVGKQSVYDIVCKEPYRNFIANNIVVHNSGKSTYALLAGAEMQKLTGKYLVMFDGEYTIDNSYMDRLGIDRNLLVHRKGNNLEDMLDEMEEFSKTDDIGMIILDSVKAFTSKVVESKSAEQDTIGIEAKKLNARMPIINGNCARRKIALLIINQLRVNPGQMFGNPDTKPGGHWQDFFPSLELHFTKGALIKGIEEEVIGHITTVRVKKSKFRPYDPKEKIESNLYYGYGFNTYDEYAKLFVDAEIIEQSGAWYTLPDGKRLHGLPKVADYLESNPDLIDKLKADL